MKWEEKENEDEKKNWYLLNAKRYYHKNQFKFIIETIGVKSCDDLLIEACNILILKFENFKHNIYNITNDNYKFILDTSIVSLKYAYDITLMNEDYTIGKVIEWIIHKNMEKFKVSYVGFIKTHPHNNSSIVRLVLDESTLNDAQKKSKIKHKEIVKEIISNTYTECIKVFNEIKDGIILLNEV